MLNLLLNNAGIASRNYEIRHTKKEFEEYRENGKYELIPNGCATVRYSNISPHLIISIKDLEKAKRMS